MALDDDPARRPTAAELAAELRPVVIPIAAGDRVTATPD
jgi:hypothetical protein